MMITFKMDVEDKEYADKLDKISDMSTGVLEIKSFSGASEFLQLGIELSPAIAIGVALVISEMIKNRRKVDIKVDDVEVKGLTEDNALKILNQLLEKKSVDKDNKNEST